MSAPRDCPGIESYQALLAATLSPEQRLLCEQHLESCSTCQEHLERADTDNELVRLARELGDPTTLACDPALAQVLQRLHESGGNQEVGDNLDLYFLAPSQHPGSLGTLGPYDVRKVIGQGGMGVVLEAHEPALQRRVAIKVLSPALAGSATARRRFIREAQAAAAVSHEHVVAVHGVHEADGLPYLVVQYIAGESLQARLERTGPLPREEVVRIGQQTASGLAAAHAQGLIHRDIKPANLLLENGLGRVKITDFGLARMVDDVGLTQNGVVTGTPEYMAPEQARGEAVDHRCDLFSLGGVLYACCTGVPPFRGGSTLAVLRKVCEEEPQSPRELNPEVPVWLETLILRLLAKNPAERFTSAATLASLLESYLSYLRQPGTIPAPELPAGAPTRFLETEEDDVIRTPWRPFPRGLLLFLGILVVLPLVLGGTLLFAWGLSTSQANAGAWQEYTHSLQNLADDRQGFEVTGPDAEQAVRFEPEGLRITLPAGYEGPPGFHGERPDTGVIVPVAVRGDLEITVDFEVLQQPSPKDAGWPQTRFSLDLGVDRATNTVTTLSRRMTTWGGPQFLAWVSLWDEAAGKHQQQHQEFPTQGMTGRLQMTRTDSMVSYFGAEGPDGPLVLLRQYPFSAEPLEDVRLLASTGGPRAALDVRFTNLHIRAATVRETRLGAPLPGGGNRWVVIAAAAVVVLVIGLGLLLGVRRQHPVAPTPPPTAQEEPAAPLAFTCSACGKRLRAKADLRGRRVRCPQCRKAVVVAQ